VVCRKKSREVAQAKSPIGGGKTKSGESMREKETEEALSFNYGQPGRLREAIA